MCSCRCRPGQRRGRTHHSSLGAVSEESPGADENSWHVNVPKDGTRSMPIVAIDGPMGAGKSTVAKLLAQRLGFRYVDTGAMYRSVGWAARQRGIDLHDETAVAAMARSLRIEFLPAETGDRVLADGVDVTEAIRSPEISEAASIVSAHPTVREVMVAFQRRTGHEGGVVMEGRDIGTVVFPDAELKIYLTAHPQARARRRYDELRARGAEVALPALARVEEERDRRDASRGHSPMRPAPDAVVIDTTEAPVESVIERILTLLRSR